jgi:uncharacterized protein (DUF3820 family)
MANKTKYFNNVVSHYEWPYPGKYQNKKMKDIPMSYLKWALENFRDNGPQSQMLQAELSRRLGLL